MTREDFIKLLNKGVITQTGLIDAKGNIKYDGDLDDLANKFITQTGITDGTSEGTKLQEWIDKKCPPEMETVEVPVDTDGDGEPDTTETQTRPKEKVKPTIEVSGLDAMLPVEGGKATVKIVANEYAGSNVTMTWTAVGATAKIANKDNYSVKSLKDKELTMNITPEINQDAYSISFELKDDTNAVLATAEVTFDVAVKVVDTASFKKAVAAGGDVKLEADIDLSEQIVVSNTAVLDLNGHNLTNTNDIWNDGAAKAWSHISVQGGNLTINGAGSVIAKKDDCYALDIRDGELTINDGTYNGNISAVYCYKGAVNINGGSFDVQQLDGKKGKAFMLNCLDAAYANKTASIVVMGGSFNGFNPAANAAETADDTTNFVAEGYTVQQDGDVYTVVKA